jgi:signal peptidase I
MRRFWVEWARPALMVACVLGSVRSAVADWNDVPTGSMKPTILEGDRIFVNKLAYDLKVPFTLQRMASWGDPKPGDIVVLLSPYDGRRLVKRVIGVPGDVVALVDNHLFVNAQAASYGPPDERFVQAMAGDGASTLLETETTAGRSHAVMVSPGGASMSSFGPVTVPPGQYLVMGDNRDNSFDSRYFGFVAREKVLGRATSVVLSVDLGRYLAPRWNRFFSPLS